MAKFVPVRRLKPIFKPDGMSVLERPKDLTAAALGGGITGLSFSNFQKRKITRSSNHSYFNRNCRRSRVLAANSSSTTSSSSSSSWSKSEYLKRKSVDAAKEAVYDELLGEPEPEHESDDDLAYFRGLVLDISYRPINVVCWKRAICLEFSEKADVLEYYDQTVNSPSGSFFIPAVLRVPHLLQVVRRRRYISTLSRKNILARDHFTCQYCSSTERLTIDHVLPASRGGEWKWENLVTACLSCNSKKGQKTPEEANMKLHKVPKAPKDYDIIAIPLTNTAIKMLQKRRGTPEEWLQYLSSPSP